MGRLKVRSQTVLMLPLSHSFGVLMMNVCYLTGCTATILPRFDAQQVLEIIHQRRVTRFPVVPTMLVHLINFPGREKYDTSCLESVNSGAAILPNEVRQQFEDGVMSLPMGMENGAPINGDLANLQYFYDRGIRYITLTHWASHDSARLQPAAA